MRRSATTSALLLFAMCALFAVEPEKPAPNPISEALCGRESREHGRATALDTFDFAALPQAWRTAKVEELDPWFTAPRCIDGTETEYALFMRRRTTLRNLRTRVDRALVVGQFEDALKEFPPWSTRENEWPAAAECSGCDALRRAATTGAKVAAEWPRRKTKQRPIGAWLDGENIRESLIKDLCGAMPGPQAREELESRFRYYTWMPRGAALVDVAKWFERPDVLAECRGPH